MGLKAVLSGHHAHSLDRAEAKLDPNPGAPWTCQVRARGKCEGTPRAGEESTWGRSRDSAGAGRWRGWAMSSLDSQQASRAASVGRVSDTTRTPQGSGPAPSRDSPSFGERLLQGRR